MNKLLKWVLAVVGLVVVLIVVAAVVLPMVVDPNDYKDEISAAVLAETGRELTIGGEIKWTVFPSVGLKLSDVSLSEIEDTGGPPMLKVGEAGLSMKLMPLFKRKIEVGEVTLSQMSANLQGNTPEASGIEISDANVTLRNMDKTAPAQEPGSKTSRFVQGGPFDLDGNFSVNVPEEQLTGDVEFSGLVQSTVNGTHLEIEGLELFFKGNQGTAGQAMPLELSVNANADYDLANDQAMLSDFVLQLYDVVVNGDLNVTSVSADPQLAGQLKLAEFNPKSLMRDLGIQVPVTRDDSALTLLQADMSFSGSSSIADMQGLTVKFDKSTFQGKLKIENFDSPHLTFDFQIDRLNLDDYSSDPEGGVMGGKGDNTDESDLTVEAFRGFTGGGDLRIGELVVDGLTATQVSLTMNSNGNGVRFYPVNADFYGGKQEGEIKVDASGTRPILTADLGMMGVQAQGLLEDLTGTARLEGTGDFFVQIRTDLTNSRSTLQTLSGDIGMSVLDGAIVGIDVADSIASVKSVLGKQDETTTKGGQDQKTEFAELSMTGVFDKGIMTSNNLSMQSTLLQATGEGTVNLAEQTINYLLKPVLLGDQLDPSLAALSGTPIPIRLTGNMYEPDIKVDIVAAIADSQKELIDQKKNEIIGQLLGGESESASDTKDGDSSKKDDPVNSLLDGVFGSKKDKKKKKDDGGGAH